MFFYSVYVFLNINNILNWPRELIFSLDSELTNKIICLRPTTVFVLFYVCTCLPL